MKREREIDGSVANCLTFLSRETKSEAFSSYILSSTERVFECKTCNKRFPSFQALGGHRASHKKPKVTDGSFKTTTQMNESPAKPKTHECSICGLEFAIGQALGGHMRRHRAAAALNGHDRDHVQEDQFTVRSSGPSGKKKVSCKGVCLDLNLTPLENDLEFVKLGKALQPAPLIDCLF